MRPSNAHMPDWWQRLWRRRYACGTQGLILVKCESGRTYRVRPMGCGCGYIVYLAGERIGRHCPTLRAAMRQIRRHSLDGPHAGHVE